MLRQGPGRAPPVSTAVHNKCVDLSAQLRLWVQTWKEAGPKLEAIHRREIREADNLQVLASLESAFNHAARTMPPRPTSGIVEMQKWFAKAPPMIDIFQTAKQLLEFCDQREWRSCIIGGIAVQRWGEPRVTRDVDLTLLTGFGNEDGFVETLLAEFPGRIDNAKEFALRHRSLLLRSPEGVGIDVSLGALPFEEEVINRATDFSFGPGLDIRTCSAEDLIVLKLFASRPLDIRDAESVAIRNREQIDWGYVEEQLRPLAEVKGEPEILLALARLRQV